MMEETKKFAKEREALLSSPKNGYDRISEADLARWSPTARST